MAYKFSFQDNRYPVSSGEDFDNDCVDYESDLDLIVDRSKYITMVGWRPDTGYYTIQKMSEYAEVFVVEIFKNNAAAFKFQDKNVNVINEDITNFEKFIPLEKRETLIWQDGPEHMHMEKSVAIIKSMQKYFKNIIISTPDGLCTQGSLYGNQHEEHLSTWCAQDYINLGFLPQNLGKQFLIGYWQNYENVSSI
jgi:hypothetical protein